MTLVTLGVIEAVLDPVFPPNESAEQTVQWPKQQPLG
jgi:hypothetical protein